MLLRLLFDDHAIWHVVIVIHKTKIVCGLLFYAEKLSHSPMLDALL